MIAESWPAIPPLRALNPTPRQWCLAVPAPQGRIAMSRARPGQPVARPRMPP